MALDRAIKQANAKRRQGSILVFDYDNDTFTRNGVPIEFTNYRKTEPKREETEAQRLRRMEREVWFDPDM
jgi:hypothetical protein